MFEDLFAQGAMPPTRRDMAPPDGTVPPEALPNVNAIAPSGPMAMPFQTPSLASLSVRVPARAATPAAQATPAARPAAGNSRVFDILKELAPLLSAAVAGKMGGKAAVTGALQGYLQSRSERDQMDLVRAQQQQKADEEKARLRAAKAKEFQEFLLGIPEKLAKLDTVGKARFLSLADDAAVSVYGQPPRAISSYFATEPSSGAFDPEVVKDAQALVKSWMPKQIEAAVKGGASVNFKGKPVKVNDLLRIAQQPFTSDGPVLAPDPKKYDEQSAAEAAVASARESALASGEKFTDADAQRVATRAIKQFREDTKSETKKYDEQAAAENAVADARKAAAAAGKPFTAADEQRVSTQAIRQFREATKVSTPSAMSAIGGDDRHSLATMLVDGRMVPSQLNKRSGYNETLAAADSLSRKITGKGYDATKAETDFKAANTWVAAANSTQRQRFYALASSVQSTLKEVMGYATELALGGLEFANRAKMQAYLKLNGNSPYAETVTAYLTAINTLKEEFANLVNAGYAPTEPAFKLANEQINQDRGYKSTNAALAELTRLIEFRVNGLQTIGVQTIGGPGTLPIIQQQNDIASSGGRGRGAGPGPSGGNGTVKKTVMQNGVTYEVIYDAQGNYLSSTVKK